MAINQTQLNNVLNYLTLVQQISNLSSTYSNNSSSSLLGNSLYNSIDSSPSLNLYGNSTNIYSSFMQRAIQTVFLKFMMNIISQLLSLFGAQTEQTTQPAQVAQPEQIVPAEVQPSHQARDIVKLTSENIESDLRNQKGTSYVVVCGSGCGRCKKFDPVLKSINNSLNSNATFYSLNYDSEKELEQKLKKESGADIHKSAGFPIIIKCVDGQAKEFYSYSDIENIYTNEEKMTEWFANKI